MLKQVQHDVKRRKMRLGQDDVRISRATFNRHPELVSGSVRGEGQVKARGEILKFAIKREQSQACLAMPSVSKLNKS